RPSLRRVNSATPLKRRVLGARGGAPPPTLRRVNSATPLKLDVRHVRKARKRSLRRVNSATPLMPADGIGVGVGVAGSAPSELGDPSEARTDTASRRVSVPLFAE